MRFLISISISIFLSKQFENPIKIDSFFISHSSLHHFYILVCSLLPSIKQLWSSARFDTDRLNGTMTEFTRPKPLFYGFSDHVLQFRSVSVYYKPAAFNRLEPGRQSAYNYLNDQNSTICSSVFQLKWINFYIIFKIFGWNFQKCMKFKYVCMLRMHQPQHHIRIVFFDIGQIRIAVFNKRLPIWKILEYLKKPTMCSTDKQL